MLVAYCLQGASICLCCKVIPEFGDIASALRWGEYGECLRCCRPAVALQFSFLFTCATKQKVTHRSYGT